MQKIPAFVPSAHLDDSKSEAHAILVKALMERMQPLPLSEVTLVKIPTGYDESKIKTRKVLFDSRIRQTFKELFVPADRLTIVTLVAKATLDGKIFYKALLGKKTVIVNEKYCTSASSQKLGPFRLREK